MKMKPFEWAEHSGLKCSYCPYRAVLKVQLPHWALYLCRTCIGRMHATLKDGQRAVEAKMPTVQR